MIEKTADRFLIGVKPKIPAINLRRPIELKPPRHKIDFMIPDRNEPFSLKEKCSVEQLLFCRAAKGAISFIGQRNPARESVSAILCCLAGRQGTVLILAAVDLGVVLTVGKIGDYLFSLTYGIISAAQ